MMRCFNLSRDGKRCKVLTVKPCPDDCFARVTDPETYIRTLEDIMVHNWDTNKQLVADLRKEIDAIRERHNLPEPQFNPREGKYAGLYQCYYEDLRRRSSKGGGSSEQNTNPAKPRTKDNRVQGTKWTKAEREEIKQKTEEWEAEHGKLEKLGFSSMSRSKVDSYTGEEIK